MAGIFIYVLKEPDTGEIRYVGKTTDPRRRLRQHIGHESRNGELHRRACWVRSVLVCGQSPEMEILDEVLREHGAQWEVAYKEFFEEQGCDLVNSTPGGDGVGSGKDHPNFGKRWTLTETAKQNHRAARLREREQRSRAMMGEKNPMAKEAVRKKVSAALSGKNSPMFGTHHTDERKQKMSVANSGEGNPMFGVRLMGEKNHNFGKPMPEAQKQEISATKSGVPWSPARRAALTR